jgi:glycerophosphoryl diester phosphodiesterase
MDTKSTNFKLIAWLILPLFLISSCNKEDNPENLKESLADYISQNSPLITAHRGFAEVAPENTMSAFEAAFKAGADASEFDVHMTIDGTLVVFHDDTIGRTTNGTGVLKELTYEYLSTLDAGSWKDPKFAGEKIPTLHQTLTYFQENNMVAVLEIKVADIVDEVLEMLSETKMDKRTVIISFEESAISKILSENPDIPALLLLADVAYNTGSTQNKVNNISQKADEIGTKYVGPFSFQLEKLDPTLMSEAIFNLTNNIDPGELPLALDAETVADLHEKGYLIDAWTVDSEENIRDLVTFKVDFLTTNYLERAIRIKKEIQNK